MAQIYLCFCSWATFRLQQKIRFFFFYLIWDLRNPYGIWSFCFEWSGGTVSHYHGDSSIQAELEWSYRTHFWSVSTHPRVLKNWPAERVNADPSGLCVYVRMTPRCVPSLLLFKTVAFSKWYQTLARFNHVIQWFNNWLWAVNPYWALNLKVRRKSEKKRRAVDPHKSASWLTTTDRS